MKKAIALLHIAATPFARLAGVIHRAVPHPRIKRNHVEMGVGVFTMFTGVTIAAFSPEHGLFHIVGDLVGYTVHAAGAVPILKHVDKWVRGDGTEVEAPKKRTIEELLNDES